MVEDAGEKQPRHWLEVDALMQHVESGEAFILEVGKGETAENQPLIDPFTLRPQP